MKHGIGDQIVERLLNQEEVSGKFHGLAFAGPQLDPGMRGGRTADLDGAPEHGGGAERKKILLRVLSHVFQGGQGQEVQKQRMETLGLARQGFDAARLVVGVVESTVVDGIDRADNSGQRGLHFMGNRGNEVAAVGFELADIGKIGGGDQKGTAVVPRERDGIDQKLKSLLPAPERKFSGIFAGLGGPVQKVPELFRTCKPILQPPRAMSRIKELLGGPVPLADSSVGIDKHHSLGQGIENRFPLIGAVAEGKNLLLQLLGKRLKAEGDLADQPAFRNINRIFQFSG